MTGDAVSRGESCVGFVVFTRVTARAAGGRVATGDRVKSAGWLLNRSIGSVAFDTLVVVEFAIVVVRVTVRADGIFPAVVLGGQNLGPIGILAAGKSQGRR